MQPKSFIAPAVGRRVWYIPPSNSASMGFHNFSDQPMDAGIVYVWNDRCVNLDVTDHAGNHHAFTSVVLLQDGDPRPTTGSYCEWMPYQKGQAAKQAQDQLDKVAVDAMRDALTHGVGGMVRTAEHNEDTIHLNVEKISVGDIFAGHPAAVVADWGMAEEPAPKAQGQRVTEQDIEDLIVAEHGFNLATALEALGHPVKDSFRQTTICVLGLENGFTVIGKSACADPAIFNQAIGNKMAREDAKRKVWELAGYALANKLAGL